jgi:hypothetical protein
MLVALERDRERVQRMSANARIAYDRRFDSAVVYREMERYLGEVRDTHNAKTEDAVAINLSRRIV